MGRLFTVDLEPEDNNVYVCKHCLTPLARLNDFLSQTFPCKNGKRYLFDRVVNISVGMKKQQICIYGWHVVVEISCVRCGSHVGWKVLAARGTAFRHKEGKFVIERIRVLGPV